MHSVRASDTHLCTLFPPRKQVGMMFTWSNKHNRWLRQIKCVYKLMDSTCAAMASKDHCIMFRCMDCIPENIPCLMPETI